MSKELTDHNYWISKLHYLGEALGYDTVREIAELIADECYEELVLLTEEREQLLEQKRDLLKQIDAMRYIAEDVALRYRGK